MLMTQTEIKSKKSLGAAGLTQKANDSVALGGKHYMLEFFLDTHHMLCKTEQSFMAFMIFMLFVAVHNTIAKIRNNSQYRKDTCFYILYVYQLVIVFLPGAEPILISGGDHCLKKSGRETA